MPFGLTRICWEFHIITSYLQCVFNTPSVFLLAFVSLNQRLLFPLTWTVSGILSIHTLILPCISISTKLYIFSCSIPGLSLELSAFNNLLRLTKCLSWFRDLLPNMVHKFIRARSISAHQILEELLFCVFGLLALLICFSCLVVTSTSCDFTFS